MKRVILTDRMNDDAADITALLAGLSISRTEATTYVALLQNDLISIRKIADRTGINRGTTYDALKKLTSLGLVSVRRQGNREHYSAESPDKIMDIIRDRRRDLADLSETAKTVLPDLIARKAARGGQPLVRYYQDDEGIVTILKDVLQTCRDLPQREYYAYSAGSIRQYLYRQFPQFTSRRVDEGIHVKVIAVGEGGDTAENAERKWLPLTNEPQMMSYTIVYGHKIATISTTTSDVPYGVIIEDAGAASMQRLLFERLWQYL